MSGKKIFGCAAVMAVVAGFLSGCGPVKPEVTASADDLEPAAIVKAVDNRYEPKEVTVRVGEAVRWDFVGGAKHDVVAADASFVSELLPSGSFTHRFTAPGKYPYICSIHPEMRGVVHVVD